MLPRVFTLWQWQQPAFWFSDHPVSWLLLPCSWLYGWIVWLRCMAYRLRLLPCYRVAAPVVVVGNITVGGTGKTPFLMQLAKRCVRLGYRPGIVMRGYRARSACYPLLVRGDNTMAHKDVLSAGDEASFLAQKTLLPVVIDPDRVRGARFLNTELGCDLILSDDGLQHYRLQRDIEIAVVDGVRRFGNGRLLPAGPLREPVSRLRSCQQTVVNGSADIGETAFTLAPQHFYSLANMSKQRSADAFQERRAHAVCGIGNPARFFDTLRSLGIDSIFHAFPDHHSFVASDLDFQDDLPILMTEKDAVKCASHRSIRDRAWVLVVKAIIPEAFFMKFARQLEQVRYG